MSFMQEFKSFVAQGNVVDLAVAVVIGGAFGKIVTAMVDGLINPLIAMLPDAAHEVQVLPFPMLGRGRIAKVELAGHDNVLAGRLTACHPAIA